MNEPKRFTIVYKIIEDHNNVMESMGEQKHCSLHWSLSTEATPDQTYDLIVACKNDIVSDLWSAQCSLKVQLIVEDLRSPFTELTHTFSLANEKRRLNNVFSLNESEELLPEEVRIECTITVIELIGVMQTRRWDLMSPTKFTDVQVVAEDTTFYSSKIVLASHIPHFKKIFFGERNKANDAIYGVRITICTPNVLERLLQIVHGFEAIEIESEIIIPLFELAHLMQADEVKFACLIEMKAAFEKRNQLPSPLPFSLFDLLALAEKHNLAVLEQEILECCQVSDLLTLKDRVLTTSTLKAVHRRWCQLQLK